MRRRPHIAVSLSTLVAGFLTAGKPGHLAYLLPAALALPLVPELARRLRGAGYGRHHLKVAGLTVVLWLPLLFLYSLILFQPWGSCMVEFSGEDYPREEAQLPPPVRRAEPAHVEGLIGPCYVGESYSAGERVNLDWAGVLNGKVLSKPGAVYPPGVSEVWGTVAVAVVVDKAGYVSAARAISGHPLLMSAAEHAACLARLSPASGRGPSAPKVRGILTYDFRE